jgi:hypothetical protein
VAFDDSMFGSYPLNQPSTSSTDQYSPANSEPFDTCVLTLTYRGEYKLNVILQARGVGSHLLKLSQQRQSRPEQLRTVIGARHRALEILSTLNALNLTNMEPQYLRTKKNGSTKKSLIE